MSTLDPVSPSLKAEVDSEIARVLPEVVAFRHERHAAPELTWKEVETAKAVARRLAAIPGLDVRDGVGKLGIVAVLDSGKPGPTVGLRADMDALPVREVTGKSYASKHDGVMHACGHDGHMANLYGSALVLAKMKDRLRGKVKLIFQPAEEGGAGARAMCEDGALKDPDVDVIFGLHGWPELACGQVCVRTGPILAATTEIRITVRGKGCHAAMPHLGTDQVLVASRIVDALQSVVARETAPTEPVALSITKFHAGTAINVIPPHAELGGTLRTLTIKSRERCEAAIRRLVAGIASAHGVSAEVELIRGYPPTVNDARATDFVEAVAKSILAPEHVRRLEAPSMGGEDFAFFLERVPGSYFFLGMDDGRDGGYPSLHHPAYDFNDKALPIGIAMFVHAAIAYTNGKTVTTT